MKGSFQHSNSAHWKHRLPIFFLVGIFMLPFWVDYAPVKLPELSYTQWVFEDDSNNNSEISFEHLGSNYSNISNGFTFLRLDFKASLIAQNKLQEVHFQRFRKLNVNHWNYLTTTRTNSFLPNSNLDSYPSPFFFSVG